MLLMLLPVVTFVNVIDVVVSVVVGDDDAVAVCG